MTPEIYDAEARVIYDRSYSYHQSCGPAEMGRVGVAIGSEVYWAGSYSFPGTPTSEYGMMVGFATELAKRWNAGRASLEGEERT